MSSLNPMITIVDYGMGNLRSVAKALEHLGAEVIISGQARTISQSTKIVLPGVGAFGDASRELQERGLVLPIQNLISKGVKFLGICLGQQLLFPKSEESPEAEGLSIFPGEVRLFRSQDVKVPHMGWNTVKINKSHPLLSGIKDGDYFYFVHSYYCHPQNSDLVAAECTYGGDAFAAMAARDNVFATQFHPEKSQAAGIRILKNFVEW